MSAFGQAGFGSRNRRNQLRSQGQMDPYGQQVRAAKQAPTFNVYQTQGTQQAAGQQQAQSQSQPAQQPAAAQPSLQLGAPAMPAYQQAQPVQPQSTGTPYSAPPKQDWLQSMSDDELKKSLSSWTAAGTSGTGGAFVDANLKAATAELARRGQSFDATGARRQQLQGDVDRVNRQISDWNDRAQPGQPRIGETFLVNGQPDQQWMQANQYWADQRRQAQTALDAYNAENPVIQTGGPGRMRTPEAGPSNAYWDNGVLIQTGGPGRMRTPEAGPSAGYWDRDTWIQTGGPGRASPGTAQPIQPQSQGTPYGQGPSAARPQALRTTSGMTGTTAAEIAAQYHHAGLPIPQWLSQGVSGMQHNSLKSSYDARYVDPAMWKNASESERMQFLGKKDAKGALIAGPDGNAIVDAWSPEKLTELARPTYGPGEDQQPQRGLAAMRTPAALNPQDRAGAAQPIQPQSQGTTYQSQPMVNDRPMRSIEDDMAADRGSGVQNAWWEAEASRRGVDPLTGAPLANRSAEQAAYHSAAYAPPDTSLPPQDEGILAYLRQRDAPKPTAQPSQQLYRTAMNSGVPDQQLAFEQDAFRNMAQRAVDREAFHGANDPYVQQFLNRMQYQGFDPRQGLSVSQHIQDAQAMRQRHAAARG